MRVLISCEYSGTFRDAFTRLGYDAVSCDLLPSDTPGKHYQGSVLDIINDGFHLHVGFPPCTFLTYVGMSNWYDDGRALNRIKAADFFMRLYDGGNIPFVAIENPQGIMSKIFRSPDPVVHPYFFGERELKRTCFWLKGLPKLQYALEDDLFSVKTACDKPAPVNISINKVTGKLKKRYFTDGFHNGKLKTSHEKSKQFVSIAGAAALQWGSFVEQKLNTKKIYV